MDIKISESARDKLNKILDDAEFSLPALRLVIAGAG
jgi:hypothetical protein